VFVSSPPGDLRKFITLSAFSLFAGCSGEKHFSIQRINISQAHGDFCRVSQAHVKFCRVAWIAQSSGAHKRQFAKEWTVLV